MRVAGGRNSILRVTYALPLAILALLASMGWLLTGCQSVESQSEIEIPLDSNEVAENDSAIIEIRKHADDEPLAIFHKVLRIGQTHVVVVYDGHLNGNFIATVKFKKLTKVTSVWTWETKDGVVSEGRLITPEDTGHGTKKDTLPPFPPRVTGQSNTELTQPMWTWQTGGGGGAGIYRHRLDNPDLSGRFETTNAYWYPDVPLAAGPHTLYVQERDTAGNWSKSGFWTVRVSTHALAAPYVAVWPQGITSDGRPVWSWTGSGTGLFRYKLDDRNLTFGAMEGFATSYQPLFNLPDGRHRLYVIEKDSQGNWSDTGSAEVIIDRTSPDRPAITPPLSPTNSARPSWSWTPVPGGSGNYRYTLDNPDFTTASETRSTTFVPSVDLSEGVHIFRVEQGDSVGNWSAPSADTLEIDLTPPAAPYVAGPVSPVEGSGAHFDWNSGGGGIGIFRYRFNGGPWYTTFGDLQASSSDSPGLQAIDVQERDEAGNWSFSGSAQANVTAALQPIAVYNLLVDASDVTGKNGALLTQGVTFLQPGAFIAGDFQNNVLTTPDIQGFDYANFTIEADFHVDGSMDTSRPVFVGGTDRRWIGFQM
jgi:hypothetical protein